MGSHSANAIPDSRECLQRLCGEESILHRVSHLLDIIESSGTGLGEVLQDYARQAKAQLRELLYVSRHVADGNDAQANDVEKLENIHFTLKSVQSVLEMTPVAMQRNKADTLGEKVRVSSADIKQTADSFHKSPDIAQLLAQEDSGRIFAPLMQTAQEKPLS